MCIGVTVLRVLRCFGVHISVVQFAKVALHTLNVNIYTRAYLAVFQFVLFSVLTFAKDGSRCRYRCFPIQTPSSPTPEGEGGRRKEEGRRDKPMLVMTHP